MRATLSVLALTALLVLAGCTAPGVTEQGTDAPPAVATPSNASVTPTPHTQTPEAETSKPAEHDGPKTMESVYGIDTNQTVERVGRLLNVEYDRPSIILSLEKTRQTGSDYREELTADPFLSTFDLAGAQSGNESKESTDNSSDGGSFTIAGYADGPQLVVMNPNLSTAQAKSTLVHELVHVIQFQKGWAPRWDGEPISAYRSDPGRGFDQMRTIMYEGPAEYSETKYFQRYYGSTLTVEDRLASFRAYYANLSGSTQLAWATYYYGFEYVADRVEGPRQIQGLYDRSPTTTEQLLHRETPATEPIAPLSVFIDAPSVEWRGTQGELFTRIALEQELNRSKAIAAAAGWGNDTLASIQTGQGQGFVWITRWDTAADAEQFQSALSTSLERHENERATRVTQVAPETVVLFAGDEAVVDEIDFRGSNGTIQVSATG